LLAAGLFAKVTLPLAVLATPASQLPLVAPVRRPSLPQTTASYRFNPCQCMLVAVHIVQAIWIQKIASF